MHLWAAMKCREGIRDTDCVVRSPSHGRPCTLGPNTNTRKEEEEEREDSEEEADKRFSHSCSH